MRFKNGYGSPEDQRGGIIRRDLLGTCYTLGPLLSRLLRNHAAGINSPCLK